MAVCQCALEKAILALHPRASVEFRRLLYEAKHASATDPEACLVHMELEEKYHGPKMRPADRKRMRDDHDRYRDLYAGGYAPNASDVRSHAAFEDPIFSAIARRADRG